MNVSHLAIFFKTHNTGFSDALPDFEANIGLRARIGMALHPVYLMLDSVRWSNMK